MNIDVLVGIATGVILFLFGIDSFSREIKTIAGDDLRKILANWTKNPFSGMCLGAIVTATIQSSTATSVLVVSLVNSAIINFRQSIGILLGTNIGTTLTAFLVAYKLTDIGPWFIVLGFILSIVRVKYSFLGKALFYFGLVFFALSQLSAITTPLKNDPYFVSFFAGLQNPLYGLLAGCGITIIIQSSSVTTGLLVILVQSGAIQLSEAIPVILGANIGTTFTGILASLAMDTYARRAATLNTIFNIGGALLFLPLLYPFTLLVTKIGGTPAQMTATAHLLFNLVSSFFFVFFIKQLEWISARVIKSNENEIVFSTKYLSTGSEGDPLKNIELEVVHYLEMSKKMLSSVLYYVDLRTSEGLDRIEKYAAFSSYLAKKCEVALHDLASAHQSEFHMTSLVRMLRIIDFIRQANVSQRQIADIPELLRLPNVEELTELKAEIFGMTSLVVQIYEHLALYIETQSRGELHKIDGLNAKLAKRINDTYEQLVFGSEGESEKIKSFFMSFLTRLQSIKAKLREVRKISVSYFSQLKSTLPAQSHN
jgi:phosphate:Na+ symporter